MCLWGIVMHCIYRFNGVWGDGRASWSVNIKEWLGRIKNIMGVCWVVKRFTQGQSRGRTPKQLYNFVRINFMSCQHKITSSYKWLSFDISKGYFQQPTSKWHASHSVWSAFGAHLHVIMETLTVMTKVNSSDSQVPFESWLISSYTQLVNMCIFILFSIFLSLIVVVCCVYLFHGVGKVMNMRFQCLRIRCQLAVSISKSGLWAH